jgi:hypothetical protein
VHRWLGSQKEPILIPTKLVFQLHVDRFNIVLLCLRRSDRNRFTHSAGVANFQFVNYGGFQPPQESRVIYCDIWQARLCRVSESFPEAPLLACFPIVGRPEADPRSKKRLGQRL